MRFLCFVLCLSSSGLTIAEESLKEITKSPLEIMKQSTKFKEPIKNRQKKPELADFATYNEFLQAMYAYQKNEEQTFKPDVLINLPTKPQSTPESSAFEPNQDVTGWGEEIPTTPIEPTP
ncbi:MAG: hypothetical protein KDI39_06610 [Pseudomonadales bacterium]|nr:hypothetical protein [Pseudomonadales bacterium]